MLYCHVEMTWKWKWVYKATEKKEREKKRTKEQKNTKKRYCGVIELIFCGKVFLMRFSVSYEEGQKGVGGFWQIFTDLVSCHRA